MTRLSPFATKSLHERVLAVDETLIRAKCRDAAANERKREILVLHLGDEDPVQRMLNALQPGSYIRPHRHLRPPKSETLVLLQGAVGFVSFRDDGAPEEDQFVAMDRDLGVVALDYRPGIWHTFFALRADTVIFEVKPGPFDPGEDKGLAPWAPPEGTADGSAYLASLEDKLRVQCGLGPRAWRA